MPEHQQHLADTLRHSDVVVNVASISGLGGDPGMVAYNVAKAGVVNFTRTAALEVAAAGIRVNAVCPGLIDTPALARAIRGSSERETKLRSAVPLARLGRPEERARDPVPRLRRRVVRHRHDAGRRRRNTAWTGIPALVPG
jgi:NAD(P)-dependent dehydrogenase (short-subunit alcohol dehydrogenase family)